MSKLSVPDSAASAGQLGFWPWLLHATGLEAWFRQAPAAARAGREERIVLLLALAGTTRATRPAHADLLARAARACQPALVASGGLAASHKPDTLLLTWPAAAAGSPAPAVALYFQLRDCVRELASAPRLGLNGAAGLAWAAAGPATAPHHYDKACLREATGLLHESQQLGSDLLLTAALHQRLAPAAVGPCALHVAFEVPGHRYPATLYRVAAPAVAPGANEEEPVEPLTKKIFS